MALSSKAAPCISVHPTMVQEIFVGLKNVSQKHILNKSLISLKASWLHIITKLERTEEYV